tara:strand:+ start:686 stop:1246 length:561 start_codon:yes stop_codon:yes gene_type:complete
MTDAEAQPESTLKAATWWNRAKAAVVDALIFFAALVAPIILATVGFVVAWNESRDEFDFSATTVLVVAFGLAMVAVVFVWGGWLFGYRQGVTGTTPGKRRLRIRLVDADTGEAPGGAKGVGRWLLPGLVGGVQGIGNVIQLIDYLWPLWDSKNQRLIDKVLKTRVVVGLPSAGIEDGPAPPVNPIS